MTYVRFWRKNIKDSFENSKIKNSQIYFCFRWRPEGTYDNHILVVHFTNRTSYFHENQISVGNRFRRTFSFKMLFRRRWKIKVTSFVKRCMCIDFVICYYPLKNCEYLYNHSWDSLFWKTLCKVKEK